MYWNGIQTWIFWFLVLFSSFADALVMYCQCGLGSSLQKSRRAIIIIFLLHSFRKILFLWQYVGFELLLFFQILLLLETPQLWVSLFSNPRNRFRGFPQITWGPLMLGLILFFNTSNDFCVHMVVHGKNS